ncbi:MAG: hypothetical protein ACRDYA_17025, partial [Egibacteraceae bacterium]
MAYGRRRHAEQSRRDRGRLRVVARRTRHDPRARTSGRASIRLYAPRILNAPPRRKHFAFKCTCPPAIPSRPPRGGLDIYSSNSPG